VAETVRRGMAVDGASTASETYCGATRGGTAVYKPVLSIVPEPAITEHVYGG
jgi:hypothetical protein